MYDTFIFLRAVITCASQPCQHGTCTDSPTGFKCACESSYTGVQCDTGNDVCMSFYILDVYIIIQTFDYVKLKPLKGKANIFQFYT